MHPKKTIVCEVCGAAAMLEVIPDSTSGGAATYTLSRTCSSLCAPTSSALSGDEAAEMTGHSWDGATGKWTRLASTAVEGWVP